MICRTNRKTSTDVEESHGLVDGEEVDTDAKLGFPEEENSHLVRYLYLASAILDISGYVIRTIGYGLLSPLLVEWCIVEVAFFKLPLVQLLFSVLSILVSF